MDAHSILTSRAPSLLSRAPKTNSWRFVPWKDDERYTPLCGDELTYNCSVALSPNPSIPSWLEVPPLSGIENPPVRTRLQELPFGDLTWENFEKLCLRLVRLEAEVEHCQLYGARGQDQQGIDLYARGALDEKFTVYQCKRVRGFGPDEIKKAVSKFLEGDYWPEKTKTFVLCTSESLVSKDRADELEKQSGVLKTRGIRLVSWDKDKLSAKLKELPELVDDFFGRAWVEVFCGQERADALGNRLDAWKVAEFRSQFGDFYRSVFNTHDPGLPLAPSGGTSPLTLQDRYVIPDVLDRRAVGIAPSGEAPRVRETSRALAGEEFEPEDPAGAELLQSDSTWRAPMRPIVERDRRPIGDWLVEEPRSVVLGGPGSGKSSLLRFIALDLLSESPQMQALAQEWGEFLPVWVPFPLWTKLISDPVNSTCSLTQLLRSWLESLDEARLWPVLERALDDERVLLLVDGLDEWAKEGAAKVALDRLLVFIGQHGVPAVLTSRPHGFARLGMQQAGWRMGEIGGFSPEQQGRLTRTWFVHWLSGLEGASTLEHGEVERRADARAREFFARLEDSQDLGELATTPLLLCLLIYLSLHSARLPRNRFEAYGTIIEHLVLEHPRRRRRAASITDELSAELHGEEVRDALASLAYRLQVEAGEGLISQDRALRAVVEHLRDENTGLGLEQREAQRLGRDVVEVGEGAVGLLVERAPGEIGFFHRALQEFLAARHFSRLPIDKQADVVEERCSDPQWREIILGTLHLTGRAEDVNRLVERMRLRALDEVEKHYTRSLLAEIAFGDFGCTAALAKTIAQETFEQIELGSWMPHRRELLRLTIEGLRSIKLREQVKARLRAWFPARERFRGGLLMAIGRWPRTKEAVEALLQSMHDEETSNRQAAAKALAVMASGDAVVGDRLISLARTTVEPSLKAAAIKSLLEGWADRPIIVNLLDEARQSASPTLRFVSILGRVRKGIHTDEDLKELLRLGSWNSDLDVWWQGDVNSTLLEGWPSSREVKEACLRSLKHERQNRRSRDAGVYGQRDGRNLEESIALRVLLQGFPQDDDVARFCQEEIKTEEHPFLLMFDRHSAFELLAENFKDHRVVVGALEEWIPKQKSWETQVTFAALVGRTPTAKAKVLSSLSEDNFPHWAAESLLNGWGMEDREVAQSLTAMANGSISQASRIWYLLPRIIEDKERCRDRLVELLRDPDCERPDFVMEGIKRLGGEPDSDVVDAVLSLETVRDTVIEDYFGRLALHALISMGPSDERVRDLAKRELTTRTGNLAAVARGYGDDPEIRGSLLSMSCPLPVQLREMIAARLETDVGDEAFAMSLLELYDHEVDPVVKTRASVNYHRRLSRFGSDVTSTVARLSANICCYGPDHDERRQAAFCGLIELGRLDVMLGARETRGENEPCAIQIETGLEPNIPLLKQVLANWNYIRETFGEEFWPRLAKRSSGHIGSIWQQFLLFADEHPPAREEAVSFLENNREQSTSPNALRFLGRARPRSHLLLDSCLRSLHIGDARADSSGEDALVAAQLLGSNFGGDSEVLAHITAHRSAERVYDKEIFALCEGWPESEELEQLFEQVREQNPPLSYGAYSQLVTRKSSSEAVARTIAGVLSEWNRYLRWNTRIVSHPVLRRLRVDDDLEAILFEKLKSGPDPSEAATIPRLIATARGLSTELRAWCYEEANAQLGGRKGAVIGVDLLAGEQRPVAHCLLDALNRDST